MQAFASKLGRGRGTSTRVMTLRMLLLLLQGQLRVLQLLHLGHRRDRTAVRFARGVQQLALRRGVIKGVPEVIVVCLALVLTDCNRKFDDRCYIGRLRQRKTDPRATRTYGAEILTIRLLFKSRSWSQVLTLFIAQFYFLLLHRFHVVSLIFEKRIKEIREREKNVWVVVFFLNKSTINLLRKTQTKHPNCQGCYFSFNSTCTNTTEGISISGAIYVRRYIRKIGLGKRTT